MSFLGSLKAGGETLWVAILRRGVRLFGWQFQGWVLGYLGGSFKAEGETISGGRLRRVFGIC